MSCPKDSLYLFMTCDMWQQHSGLRKFSSCRDLLRTHGAVRSMPPAVRWPKVEQISGTRGPPTVWFGSKFEQIPARPRLRSAENRLESSAVGMAAELGSVGPYYLFTEKNTFLEIRMLEDRWFHSLESIFSHRKAAWCIRSWCPRDFHFARL